jgi:hypothetical protein
MAEHDKYDPVELNVARPLRADNYSNYRAWFRYQGNSCSISQSGLLLHRRGHFGSLPQAWRTRSWLLGGGFGAGKNVMDGMFT